jgi:hypothetical protein
MLRLVHPAPEGQGRGAPARRRRSALSLTQDERRHLAAALQNLRRAFGTWACLADAMGVDEQRVKKAGTHHKPSGSPALALRTAKVSGMSVEMVLGGKLTAAGRCGACGSRLGHGAIARAAAGGAS